MRQFKRALGRERENKFNFFITVSVLIAMVCTFVSFSSKQSVLATNYDVVIETTMTNQTTK